MAGAVQQEIDVAIASFFKASLPPKPPQGLVETALPARENSYANEVDEHLEAIEREERREELWGHVWGTLGLLGFTCALPGLLYVFSHVSDEQKISTIITQDPAEITQSLAEFVDKVGQDPALANLSEEDRALFNQIQLEQARLHRSAWDKSNFQQEEHRKLQAEADFLTTTLRQLRLKMHSQENR